MVPQPQNPQWPSEYPIMADRVRIFGCSHHQKSLSGQRILRAAPRQIRTLDYCLQNPKWPPGSSKRARRVKTSWGWAGPSSDQLLARYTSIEALLRIYTVTVVNCKGYSLLIKSSKSSKCEQINITKTSLTKQIVSDQFKVGKSIWYTQGQ